MPTSPSAAGSRDRTRHDPPHHRRLPTDVSLLLLWQSREKYPHMHLASIIWTLSDLQHETLRRQLQTRCHPVSGHFTTNALCVCVCQKASHYCIVLQLSDHNDSSRSRSQHCCILDHIIIIYATNKILRDLCGSSRGLAIAGGHGRIEADRYHCRQPSAAISVQLGPSRSHTFNLYIIINKCHITATYRKEHAHISLCQHLIPIPQNTTVYFQRQRMNSNCHSSLNLTPKFPTNMSRFNKS